LVSGMTTGRVVGCALGGALLVAVAGQALAADVSAGRALAEACAACHGANGVSQIEFTPSLAGQPDEFVQWQLVYFRSGARVSDVMGPIAEALNNQDIRDLGAYYASLSPPQPAPEASDAAVQKGEQIALRHRCRSCHGDDYNGFRAAARLSGQREEVLVKALHDFKSGKRVGSGVASMADVTYGMSDSDMDAVSHYLAMRQ
jgi:cytochrome c553